MPYNMIFKKRGKELRLKRVPLRSINTMKKIYLKQRYKFISITKVK